MRKIITSRMYRDLFQLLRSSTKYKYFRSAIRIKPIGPRLTDPRTIAGDYKTMFLTPKAFAALMMDMRSTFLGLPG